MTTATDYDALLALCNTVKPTYEPGKIPATHPAGFAVLHAGVATPTDRMLCATGDRLTVHRLVCVGTTSRGARTLANLMTNAIDGIPHERSVWLVVYASDPLEDRGDPDGVSWSSTVEIHHHTRS